MSVDANAKLTTVVTGMTEDEYEYRWKIKGFSWTMVDGPDLESTKFEIHTGKDSVLQSRWELNLEKESTRRSPVLQLNCKLLEIFSSNGRNEILAGFTAKLLKADSEEVYMECTAKVKGNLKLNESGLPSLYPLATFGYWDGLLDASGTLTVLIKLSVLEPLPVGTKVFEQQLQAKSFSMLKRNMEGLMASDTPDVKIICNDGKEIKCHTSILKLNSPVFKSMLESGLSEAKTGVVNVNDISGSTMEILIRYLYTGELLPSWNEPEIILGFTYAAGKYQLPELLDFLDNVLGRNEGKEYSRSLLISLLDMAQKLSLKKAEAYLKDRVVKLSMTKMMELESAASFLSV